MLRDASLTEVIVCFSLISGRDCEIYLLAAGVKPPASELLNALISS